MTDQETLHEIFTLLRDMDLPEALKRLKGMQGPEQGLVGESRSDEPTGYAEEAQPGERRVGETVERAELRRQIERQIKEARADWLVAKKDSNQSGKDIAAGQMGALGELAQWLDRTAEERSGLSNAELTHPESKS